MPSGLAISVAPTPRALGAAMSSALIFAAPPFWAAASFGGNLRRSGSTFLLPHGS
jgi:hypothetical protein